MRKWRAARSRFLVIRGSPSEAFGVAERGQWQRTSKRILRFARRHWVLIALTIGGHGRISTAAEAHYVASCCRSSTAATQDAGKAKPAPTRADVALHRLGERSASRRSRWRRSSARRSSRSDYLQGRVTWRLVVDLRNADLPRADAASAQLLRGPPQRRPDEPHHQRRRARRKASSTSCSAASPRACSTSLMGGARDRVGELAAAHRQRGGRAADRPADRLSVQANPPLRAREGWRSSPT